MIDAGFKLVYESPFGCVYYSASRAVVYVRRTSLPFAIDAFGPEVDGLLEVLAGVPFDKTGLILDVRPVVGRNDETFEAASLAVRRRFIARFGRAAILVRTVAGQLQGQRFLREDRLSQRTLVTDELAKAEAFLDGWERD